MIEIKILRQWLLANKRNEHKLNLIEFLQDRICKYSTQEATPADQIKGMNRLLKDIIDLTDPNFEE